MRTFNHPTFNLIFGERLYYLLINGRSDLFEIRDHLLDAFRKSKLDNTSCAYFIFGESDLLVRVWASESQLNTFLNIFRSLSKENEIKNFLITNCDTWYQREIESRENWKECLQAEKIAQLLQNGTVPAVAQFSQETIVKDNPTKFFVIVEEPFGKGFDVFRLLQEDIRQTKPSLLARMESVSLYAFMTDRFRGVLIKGEAKNYHEVSEQLVIFAKELKIKKYAIQTTTYFCAKVVKTEEAEISADSKTHAHLRKNDLAYNLLKAHDCHEEQWHSDSRTRNRSNAFKTIVGNNYEKLFIQHGAWWKQINELRRLYRWVVRRHDENLRGFLISQYIALENYFRKLFESHPALWRDNRRSAQLANKLSSILGNPLDQVSKALAECQNGNGRTEEFTLKHIRACASAAKEIHANKEANKIIDEFCRVLEDNAERLGVIKNRNDLMHGNIINLFDDSGAKEAWPDFVVNYIQLSLLLPRIKSIFQEALSQTDKVNQITQKRSTEMQ